MRDAENIRALEAQARPDLMGFICWERSSRHVSEVPTYLPECQRVGVFVNPTIDYVRERIQSLGLSFVQLHGSESPEFCREVQSEGVKVIKAISVATPEDIQLSERYQEAADLLLFDTKCPSVGGSGQQFDWSVLIHYQGSLPFLLSGGIGPGDAERVRQWQHPRCIGIDINSRFELAPAMKDVAAVARFIGEIR